MGGKSKQENYSQSQSQPWAPTMAPLQQIISGISAGIPSYQPNATEQAAFGQLTQNSQSIPNFAPQAENLTNQFLTGDPTGLLGPALQSYNAALGPIAGGSVDPYSNPATRALIDTIKDDVSKSVNGQFAGAGRDLSGLNSQYLARGLSQGMAAPLFNQYNQNVQNVSDAATKLYGAAGMTSQQMGQNQQQGFNFADMIPALKNASPLGVIQAQQMQRQAPVQNLGMFENLLVPIAGLGSQSSGQSVGYNTPGPMQTALGWSQVMGNMFGGMTSPASNLLKIFSGGK